MKKMLKLFCALLASTILLNPIGYTRFELNTSNAVEEAETPSIWDGTSDTSWYDSEEIELHISTAEELAGFRDLVNAGQKMENQTIILDNDIYLNDISNYDNWKEEPPNNVWKGINEFAGCFDGNNNRIYGVYITNWWFNLGSNWNACGFFNTSYGTIKNVSLVNEFSIYSSSYSIFFGGLCGYGAGNIDNCSVSINNYNAEKYGNSRCGGICGTFSGTISKCIANGTTKYYSERYACNGICGNLTSGSISECANHMSGCISGIVGNTGENTIISNCYNTAETSYSGIAETLGKGASINNVYNIGKATYGISWTYEKVTFESCYYLSDSSTQGTGKGTDPSGVISKNEKNMKIEKFAESLGTAFMYKEDSYPILCFESGEYLSINERSISMSKYNEEKTLSISTDKTRDISWLSSDTSVAIVENGKVKAVGNGTATIYAVSGNLKAECPVTVSFDYMLDKTELTLDPDASSTITVINSDGTKIDTPFDVVWKSNNTKAATVKNGEITAVGAGKAEITAEFGGLKLVCTVTVNQPISVNEPELNMTSVTIKVGENKQLTVKNYSGNITWLSSDANIVKVSKSGEITALKAGNATIYAMLDNNKALSCAVTAKITKGDANYDGKVNVADLVMLNKWLLGTSNELTCWQNVDLCEDNRVDIFDMVMLRKIIIENK